MPPLDDPAGGFDLTFAALLLRAENG